MDIAAAPKMRGYLSSAVLALSTLVHGSIAATRPGKPSVPTYKNPKAAIEDRVNDLLSRMTIEEKAAQLQVTQFFMIMPISI